MSQKESTLGDDIRRTKSPVDSLSVNTLITMIGALGNNKIDQLVAFKTREVCNERVVAMFQCGYFVCPLFLDPAVLTIPLLPRIRF